jgi:hypothetical protein
MTDTGTAVTGLATPSGCVGPTRPDHRAAIGRRRAGTGRRVFGSDTAVDVLNGSVQVADVSAYDAFPLVRHLHEAFPTS